MELNKTFILLSFITFTFQLQAEISLPHFFSDHMVLQQNEDIVIFGLANPLEEVSITFNNSTLKTIAKSDGSWSVVFKPRKAGGPFEMELQGENKIHLKDIYIGEVWFCSGQSNMGWTIEKSENGLEELAKANFKKIKLLNVSRSMSSQPEADIDKKNTWKTCTTENAKGFSAAAYYFGKALYEKHQVPIGLIHSSWGGSTIEAWMNAEAFKDDADKQAFFNKMKNIDFNQLAKNYKVEEKAYHKYLEENDNGTKENWELLTTDYSNWETVKLPSTWRRAKIEPRYGIVWVTKVITLSEAEIQQIITLSLGRIDNEDITFFNGKTIGSIKKNDVLRNYSIPKELLKIGENRITIRVKNPLDTGGFRGSEKDVFIKIGNTKKSLANDWNYKISTPNIKSPPERVHPKHLPSSLYNAMLYPFFNYKIKGVIWYQGESNLSRSNEYGDFFPEMITDWRAQWKKELPFIFVQLPNLANRGNRLPKFREAQNSALQLNNVGVVTTIDIGDDYNIHPINKKDVGHRLALVASDLVYGDNEKNYKPVITKIQRVENYIILKFKNEISIIGNASNILGFEISEDEKKYKSTSASLIDDKTIQINIPINFEAKHLQYLWKDAPKKVMIYSAQNYPLAPFQKTLD